jgi:excisionase family DNA binding protein
MVEKITLSVSEVAERTGISRTYLFGDIKSGKLPSLKVGKLRLIRAQDIPAYLAQYDSPKAA